MSFKDKSLNNILAVDLGKKFIGLAVFKPSIGIKSVDGFSYNDQYEFKEKLISCIDEYEVNLIVCGDMGLLKLPKNIEKLLSQITKEKNIDFVSTDERLSSFQAKRDLPDKASNKDLSYHSQAAVNILQDYLTS